MNYDKYRPLPFWSWNDKLEIEELKSQINWMKEQGFGGYFMHARGGLITEYLGKDWFECIKACCDEGEKLGMQSWAYDENGWPSGFVGGKLLDDEYNRDRYLTYTIGEYDAKALVSYNIDGEKLIRVNQGGEGQFLNIYENIATSTADILNPKVVQKFIDATHEQYKKQLGEDFNKKLKGFFTDEPQYYRWGHPYTQVLPEYFLNKYNEDILDNLGLMFIEKQGYRAFRYKYWLAMQDLMLNGFAKMTYEWCDKNGIKLTGHYIEESSLAYQLCCCSGIMPFYEYEHIPGIDKLGRNTGAPLTAKQVSSVAKQLGKNQVLTETFAMCGWNVTPAELKTVAEMQYVNGVNLMCQHLVPYSEHGQRKRDYPAHFSHVSAWAKDDFKPFNDYFAKLGYMLGESEEVVNVGLFNPIRSMYFDYKREDFEKGVEYDVDNYFQEKCWELSKANLPYHLLDETIMEKFAHVENGKLHVGKCSYEYVIFPKTYTMGNNSYKLISEFINQGGKVLFTDAIPEYLEGEKFDYNFASNCTLEDIINAQEYKIDNRQTEVFSTLRELDGKKFIYATNLNKEKDYVVEFTGNFKGFDCYNLETDEIKPVSNKLYFEKGQSYVLYLNDDEQPFEDKKDTFNLVGPFEIASITDNYLTIDKVRYSKDGVNYSEKLSCLGVHDLMLQTRFNGELYLKYEFEIKDIPAKIDLLMEDLNNISVSVNGNEVEFTGVSDFEKQLYRANIAKFVKIGNNEIVSKIHYFQEEGVYYALYGENVTESLKNCLVYNTTVEACYLQGDFGVYASDGMKLAKNPWCWLGENFYISKRKTVTCGEIVQDGYPFFAGKIVLKTKFNKPNKPVLELAGRHHVSKVKINGIEVPKSYFSYNADISNYIVDGENQAEITLILANRNLLGPHHHRDVEEPSGVSPATFELTNTWTDGKSYMERDNYSFVKLGLFDDKFEY